MRAAALCLASLGAADVSVEIPVRKPPNMGLYDGPNSRVMIARNNLPRYHRPPHIQLEAIRTSKGVALRATMPNVAAADFFPADNAAVGNSLTPPPMSWVRAKPVGYDACEFALERPRDPGAERAAMLTGLLIGQYRPAIEVSVPIQDR